jgi:endonuclease/exonuclease/phosphatase family metal-dependent hydrolase
MNTLRICTLNVHSWTDAEGVTRTDDVIALLRGIACDVVLLNEVPDADEGGDLHRVAGALSMHAAYAPAQFAGNAILARAPLLALASLELGARREETRSAAIAEVEVDGEAFVVACTHLEHRREVRRVEQLVQLHGELTRRARGRPVLLGGDFNALRLSDYPPDVLARVKAHRAANGWEAPVGTVVARLDAWGWVDAARLADAGSHAAYPAALARPIAPALARTCWAGTRIDYLWLDASLAARVQRVEAAVADVDVSDHRPLVVTLRHERA